MSDPQHFHVFEATPLSEPRAHSGKHRMDCEMVRASDYAALTVERDRLQQEKDRWFIECERLANGLLDQFEEEADDGEGGLSPFKAVDTAFRLLDDYTALAAAVTQERDTLKQDLEKANTIASNGLDEIRRLVERVQALDAAASWTCKVRALGATDPPQDCDWPHCGCDPKADAVLVALEEEGTLPAAASWQDIATAPKDGTRVLTWDGFLCGTGRVHCDPSHPDGYFVQDGGGRATHWIRPPAASRREEEPT